MPRLYFTPNLQRHLACPPGEAAGQTVRDVLEAYFVEHPNARGYVLDDQGALRPHMVIFVDNEPIADRVHLSDAVAETAEVFVMQALSGGAYCKEPRTQRGLRPKPIRNAANKCNEE